MTNCFELSRNVLAYNLRVEIVDHLVRATVTPNLARTICEATHRQTVAEYSDRHRAMPILAQIDLVP